MSGALHLLPPPSSSRELVDVLNGLLEAAKDGALNGLIFGASFKGQCYMFDAAGELYRNPVLGIGVATMLTAELEHRVRLSTDDLELPAGA